MKKNRYIVLLILMLFTTDLFSQTDSIKYIAFYNFIYKYDTTNKHNALKENMGLILGEKSSVFLSYDNYLQDSLLEYQMKQAIVNRGMTGVDLTGRKQTLPIVIYKSYASNITQVATRIFDKYIMNDTFPLVKWELKNKTDTFLNIVCGVATCNWRGRNYTALFAPSIPFSAGPYKFFGLPGLIVKIWDTKGDIYFEMTSFEKRSIYKNSYVVNPLVEEATKISKAEYKKLIHFMENDPFGFYKSQAAILNLELDFDNAPAHIKFKQPKKINNPIELTEH